MAGGDPTIEQEELEGVGAAIVQAGRPSLVEPRPERAFGQLKAHRALPVRPFKRLLEPTHGLLRLLRHRDEDALILVGEVQGGPKDAKAVESVEAVTPLRR